MDQKLKDYYLAKITALPEYAGTNNEHHIRKMANRLADQFDEIWLKYEKGEATFNQWKQALEKWLKAECI